MKVTVNGEPRELDGTLNVAGLIVALGLDTRKVAVERNLEIVPRSAYENVAVLDGDAFEIVRFIGGG